MPPKTPKHKPPVSLGGSQEPGEETLSDIEFNESLPTLTGDIKQDKEIKALIDEARKERAALKAAKLARKMRLEKKKKKKPTAGTLATKQPPATTQPTTAMGGKKKKEKRTALEQFFSSSEDDKEPEDPIQQLKHATRAAATSQTAVAARTETTPKKKQQPRPKFGSEDEDEDEDEPHSWIKPLRPRQSATSSSSASVASSTPAGPPPGRPKESAPVSLPDPDSFFSSFGLSKDLLQTVQKYIDLKNKLSSKAGSSSALLDEITPLDLSVHLKFLQDLDREAFPEATDLFAYSPEDSSKGYVIAGKAALVYQLEASNKAYLDFVAVRDAYRGRGLGRKLMERFLSDVGATKSIYLRIMGETKDRLVPFYRKFGFVLDPTIPIYRPNGVGMTRPVPKSTMDRDDQELEAGVQVARERSAKRVRKPADSPAGAEQEAKSRETEEVITEDDKKLAETRRGVIEGPLPIHPEYSEDFKKLQEMGAVFLSVDEFLAALSNPSVLTNVVHRRTIEAFKQVVKNVQKYTKDTRTAVNEHTSAYLDWAKGTQDIRRKQKISRSSIADLQKQIEEYKKERFGISPAKAAQEQLAREKQMLNTYINMERQWENSMRAMKTKWKRWCTLFPDGRICDLAAVRAESPILVHGPVPDEQQQRIKLQPGDLVHVQTDDLQDMEPYRVGCISQIEPDDDDEDYFVITLVGGALVSYGRQVSVCKDGVWSKTASTDDCEMTPGKSLAKEIVCTFPLF